MYDLEKALVLREDGRLQESNILILNCLKKHPNNAQLNYQCAWSFDILEKETQAIKYYEKALNIGLPEKDKSEAYLGLASTYRSIGEYEKSLNILEKAINEFDNNSLKVFYAMALYNLKEYSKSTEILLKLISNTSNDPSIISYKKAINFYSDKLDKKFS